MDVQEASALEARILGKLERGEALDPFERLEHKRMTAVDEPGAPMPGVTMYRSTGMVTPNRHRRAGAARRPRCGSRHRRSRRGRVSSGHARRSATSRDDGDGGPGDDGEVDRGAGRGGVR